MSKCVAGQCLTEVYQILNNTDDCCDKVILAKRYIESEGYAASSQGGRWDRFFRGRDYETPKEKKERDIKDRMDRNVTALLKKRRRQYPTEKQQQAFNKALKQAEKQQAEKRQAEEQEDMFPPSPKK